MYMHKKVAKPSSVDNTVQGRPGIFGVNKPVGGTLKAAGGAQGYDAFTKDIKMKRGASSPPNLQVPKVVYVGHGGGKTGAGTGKA